MELADTVKLMQSDDFKARFCAEYQQTKIRRDKLEEMLEKYKAGTLAFQPKCSYELFYKQLVFMDGYLQALYERAEIENIPLQIYTKEAE